MYLYKVNWQVTSITWIYLIIAFITLQIGLTIYFRKSVAGRLPFFFMMLMLSEWTLAAAFESAVNTIPFKLFFSQVEYIGALTAPVFFLRFILTFMEERKLIPGKVFWLLWVIPVTVILLAWLNDYLHIVWKDFSWSPAGNNILIYHHGPGYYVAAVYSVLLIITGNVLLIRQIVMKPVIYARKAWYTVPASLFPVFTVILYLSKVNPLEGLDISPMGIMFSGIIFLTGIIRDELFDIVPVGHRTMIEKLPDGLLVLTRGSHIVDINPAFRNSFGMGPDCIGRELEKVFPSLAERLRVSERDHDDRFEFHNGADDARWYDVIKTVLYSRHHRLLGFLLIMRDITIRKGNELALKRISDDLKVLNTTKDKLFSIISHDLRSPFNSILGFSNLLIDAYDESTDEERKHFARQVKTAADGAYRLLENLLVWSNIQRGRITFNPEEMDLALLINEVFHTLRPSANEKGIILQNQVENGTMVFADPNMAATVFRNLINNSIKFTEKGGLVRISSLRGQNSIDVMVTDTGVGMNEESIGNLFRIETMFTTTGTGSEKGTGLGLILCYEFVQMHKGTIKVSSEPGRGSTFTVSLPLI